MSRGSFLYVFSCSLIFGIILPFFKGGNFSQRLELFLPIFLLMFFGNYVVLFFSVIVVNNVSLVLGQFQIRESFSSQSENLKPALETINPALETINDESVKSYKSLQSNDLFDGDERGEINKNYSIKIVLTVGVVLFLSLLLFLFRGERGSSLSELKNLRNDLKEMKKDLEREQKNNSELRRSLDAELFKRTKYSKLLDETKSEIFYLRSENSALRNKLKGNVVLSNNRSTRVIKRARSFLEKHKFLRCGRVRFRRFPEKGIKYIRSSKPRWFCFKIGISRGQNMTVSGSSKIEVLTFGRFDKGLKSQKQNIYFFRIQDTYEHYKVYIKSTGFNKITFKIPRLN